MSKKEIKRRLLLSQIMRKAWKLFKTNIELTFSKALKLAWRIVKGIIHPSFSKIKGVTFENRQALIYRLSKYSMNKIILSLVPEPNNQYDSNAIKITASVIDKGSATIGYVSKELATKFNKLISNDKSIYIFIENFTGTHTTSLGINYSYYVM
ncbi:HIRAN domain-containing protein [Clostridium tertium]|uniref:HIRAN domain-containing protein n=1 Tax=Clostridium tertium TaxID=1559 RepID=UPI00325B7C4E